MCLSEYYTEYKTKTGECTNLGGHTCPRCNIWVSNFEVHTCSYPHDPYIPWYTPVSTENKTEKAFNVLKLLVKEGLIKEPKSFKAFCDLIEKMTGVV